MYNHKVCILRQPVLIDTHSLPRVIVRTPYHGLSPVHGTVPGILARDTESFLRTEPPLVIRKELDIDVVHYCIIGTSVEVVDVEQACEVRVFPQRSSPLGLPQSRPSNKAQSSRSLRLCCNGESGVASANPTNVYNTG